MEECPECGGELLSGQCEDCGYTLYRQEIRPAVNDGGNIYTHNCGEGYCIKKVCNTTEFCKYLDRFNQAGTSLTVTCTPRYRGEVTQ